MADVELSTLGTEIKTAYEAEADTNAFADADETKLDGLDDTAYKGQTLDTTTAYELVLGDAGKIVDLTNAAAIALTIPANSAVAFPINTRIDIHQNGAGLVTVGITTDTLRGEVISQGQYKFMSLWKRAATEWVVAGGTT